MTKFELLKLTFLILNHPQQYKFGLLVMLNILQIPKKSIWWRTSFKKVAALHTVTFLIVNSVTEIILKT